MSNGRRRRTSFPPLLLFLLVLFLLLPLSAASGQTRFVRGDANADGAIDLSDAVFVLGYLFLGGPAPPCMKAADANAQGGDQPDISDAVYLLAWLFLGGKPPAPPSPSAPSYATVDCGTDPAGEGVCDSFPPCAECPPPDGPIDTLLQSSTIVFQGTIRELEASTLLAVPVNDSTAIVSVDQVLRAPPDLGDTTGSLVTLQLDKPGSIDAGQAAVFFASTLLIGQGLAVREVGRIDVAEIPALLSQIAEADRKREDKAVLARIAAADLMVVGKVVATKHLDQDFWPSEHYPDWWQAVIQVESVEKGQSETKQIAINFPGSNEEGWRDSPKPREGDRGVWILRRDQREVGWPVFAIPGLTALNPLDFQAPDQLPRVKELIPCAR